MKLRGMRQARILIAVGVIVGFVLTAANPGRSANSAEIPFAIVKLFIEYNSTDDDGGLQALFDGEGWRTVKILGPGNRTILEITAQRGLRQIIENSDQSAVAAKTEEWKYILPVKQDNVLPNEEQLFHLTADPKEEKNVARENVRITAQLKSVLEEYLKHNKASVKPELSEEEREKMKALGYVD